MAEGKLEINDSLDNENTLTTKLKEVLFFNYYILCVGNKCGYKMLLLLIHEHVRIYIIIINVL